MRIINIIIYSILLISTPSFFVFPQDRLPQIGHQIQKKQKQNIYSLSYDEIIHLLEELESGELEKKYSPEDLEKINHFFAFLAKKGSLPNDSNNVLDNDIANLFIESDSFFSYATDNTYTFFPAFFNYDNNNEIVLCKSWFKKSWEKTKKFVKKHKKEIIIGAAIVVAATAVVVAIAVIASTSTAAGVAGAAGAVASEFSNSDEGSIPDYSTEDSSAYEKSVETPILKQALDEQIISFKENVVKEQFFEPQYEDYSQEENGRVLGSLFAHNTFKNLQNEMETCPQFSQEIEKMQWPLSISEIHVPNYGHQEIDQKFSTDYSSFFEGSENRDITALAYQMQGEKAMAYDHYD